MQKINGLMSTLKKYTRYIFIPIGLLCVIFNKFILQNVNYFFGGVTAFLGLFYFIVSLFNATHKTHKIPVIIISFLLLALGSITIIFGKVELGVKFVIVLWVTNGIIKVFIHLIFGIKQAKQKQKSAVYTFIMGIAILVITVLLILHGEGGLKLHIIFYGLESFLSTLLFTVGVKDCFTLWDIIDLRGEREQMKNA